MDSRIGRFQMDMDAPVVQKGRFEARTARAENADQSAAVLRAVALAKAGDSDGLRFLYIHYADNVYGYVKSVIRDEHEAEDVTQQVFTKLMGIIGKYEQRDVPFAAWIMRVAHNVAVDHIRRRRALPSDDIQVRPDAPQEDLRQEASFSLREALEGLPLDQREVLVMRHIVGLSPSEIAARLGKTESSIHGLHHRGRASLRQTLVRLDSAPVTASSR